MNWATAFRDGSRLIDEDLTALRQEERVHCTCLHVLEPAGWELWQSSAARISPPTLYCYGIMVPTLCQGWLDESHIPEERVIARRRLSSSWARSSWH